MKKDVLNEAIFSLKKGDLIVYPTDTLYGIGADIYNKGAVKKVFEIKKRPFDKPLSVAVSGIEKLEEVAFLDKKSRLIAERFFPGPICLILKKKDIVPDIVTSGSKKVAIRIPDSKIALELINRSGPITCTSANIHGESTPNVVSRLRMQFKNLIAVYINEGELSSAPSTIVDVTSDKIKIIREGKISNKEILDAMFNG